MKNSFGITSGLPWCPRFCSAVLLFSLSCRRRARAGAYGYVRPLSDQAERFILRPERVARHS